MNMRNRCISCLVTVLATAVLSGEAAEQESKLPTMPRQMLELKKHGTVKVEKDAEGKTSSIKLIVTSYEIVLDEGSKQLEDMDGQKVKVLATYKEADGADWLTVKSVEPFYVQPELSEPAQQAEEPAGTQAAEPPAPEGEDKKAEEAPEPAPEPASAE